MEVSRLDVSPRLKSLMAYPKMVGERPRMLVLESNYWLDGACKRAAEGLGWDLAVVPTRMEGVLPREMIAEFLQTLAGFRPDFILSINLSGMDEAGLFAHLLADLEIPHVTWFVDDPRTIMVGRQVYGTPYSVALTWERAYTGYLDACGFAAVHWLPLAADLTQFDGAADCAAAGAPAFVGNSMTVPSAHERDWLAAHPVLLEAIHAAFDAGQVTRAKFGEGLEAMLGAAACAGLDAHQRRHAEIYCFAEGTRRLRERMVRDLEGHGLEVFGDTHWREISPGARPWVEYEDGLAGHYRQCGVNLNVTSIQMPTAVNQRVFDCPAAGGFLLTDGQGDLAELFAADELCTYREFAEAGEKMTYYRENGRARGEIAGRARARILGEHTYRHRLERIAGIVREEFGG